MPLSVCGTCCQGQLLTIYLATNFHSTYKSPPAPSVMLLMTLKPPPPLSSRATGTRTMLMWSAPALALAAGAFLYLSREDKKETLGVGSGGVSKLKGSKHNSGPTLSSGPGGIGGPPMKGTAGSKADGTKAGSKADYQVSSRTWELLEAGKPVVELHGLTCPCLSALFVSQEVYNAIASKLDKVRL